MLKKCFKIDHLLYELLYQVIKKNQEFPGEPGKGIDMTDKEKEIVKELNHPLYTVEFLEEWKDREDNVFVNAPAALQAMGANGYYDAVKQMAVAPRATLPKTVALNHFSKPAENEKDTVEVGEYVYARDSATEYGFTKNHLYEILDTNGFDTVLMMNDKQEMINMSVEYFSSYSTLN